MLSDLPIASKVNFTESQGGKNWEYYIIKHLYYPWSSIVLLESELIESSKPLKIIFNKYNQNANISV